MASSLPVHCGHVAAQLRCAALPPTSQIQVVVKGGPQRSATAATAVTALCKTLAPQRCTEQLTAMMLLPFTPFYSLLLSDLWIHSITNPRLAVSSSALPV